MEDLIKNKPHKKSNNKKTNPYIDMLYKKIQLFEERGEYEKAILYYDRILEMYPNDEHALLYKNNLINLQGKQERMYT